MLYDRIGSGHRAAQVLSPLANPTVRVKHKTTGEARSDSWLLKQPSRFGACLTAHLFDITFPAKSISLGFAEANAIATTKCTSCNLYSCASPAVSQVLSTMTVSGCIPPRHTARRSDVLGSGFVWTLSVLFLPDRSRHRAGFFIRECYVVMC